MKASVTKSLLSIGFGVTLTTAVGIAAPQNASPAPSEQSSSSGAATTLFKTTVRRVVLDVVVADAAGKPVHGLTKDDFSIAEDGKPQKALSFEANGFDAGMDYLPPKLPAEPVNTFVNLPKTPEKGPLYVLLYDLANMDNPDQQVSPGDFSFQMSARQQLVKFIEGKPEGARFAIFVWSDGLHLIQGFTSDKVLLMAAVDPRSPRPHLPRVFMMGQNSGANNVHETLRVLNYIAGYLNGLHGRKNLIWFSGTFPLTLFPTNDDSPTYADQIKTTLDMIAQDQIAIYPVDARGVLVANPRAATGDTGSGGGLSSDARDKGLSAPGSGPPAAAAAAASQATTGGDGISLVANSYMIQDEIARATGGRAFHSTNGVAGALLDATEDGSSYYTMTYSPSNQVYDGKLRKIGVSLDKKGYQLAYRRAYYGSDTDVPMATPKSQASLPPPPRKPGDTLYANMEHGAPIAHQLIFGTHIHAVGSPAMGTAEQMAELATQPAYFKVRRKSAQPKPLAPMKLQRYAVDYTVMAHQLLAASGAPPSLEVATAAYDSDGQMLNAMVNNATTEESDAATTQPQKAYRIQQQFDVPLTAASIRVAVRDTNTNRIGAMEVRLPLAAENESAAVPKVRK